MKVPLFVFVLVSAAHGFVPARREASSCRLAAEMSSESEVLYVTNLDYRTSPEELRRAFGHVARVSDVSLPIDAKTGRGRGYALVSVDAADSEAAVWKMQGRKLSGRPLNVIVDSQQDHKADVALNRELSGLTVEELVKRAEPTWSSLNLVTALHRLASERVSPTPVIVEAALTRIIDEGSAIGPRSLANLVWSAARLNEGALFDAALSAARPLLTEMKAVELSQVASACAARGVMAENGDDIASAALTFVKRKGSGRTVATVAIALSKGSSSSSIVDRFFREVAAERALLGAMETRELITTASALSRWAVRDTPRREQVERLLEAVLVPRLLLDDQHLDSLPMAAAALSGMNKTNTTVAALENIAATVTSRVGELSPRVMAQLCLSLAKSGIVADQLFLAVATTITVDEMKPRDVAALVEAFARCRVRSTPLMEAIAAFSTSRVAEFTARDLATTTDGLALLAVEAPEFYRAVANHIMQDEQPCFLDFASGLAGRLEDEECVALVERLAPSLELYCTRDLVRLQSLKDAHEEAFLSAKGGPLLATACRKAVESQTASEASVKRSRRLSETLYGLGFETTREDLDAAIYYFSDLAVQVDGPARYVIELDAAASANLTKSSLLLKGKADAFKKRVIGRLGWRRLALAGAAEALDGPTRLRDTIAQKEQPNIRVAKLNYAAFDKCKTDDERAACLLECLEKAFGEDTMRKLLTGSMNPPS